MIRLTFCLCFYNIISVRSTDVETTLGPIRGKLVRDDLTGVSYNSFEGIPYAEPPVGDLRFKPPVQRQPWSTVFDATKPGCVCPQTELYYTRKEMNEDCLNFNVYTPADSMNKSLPVIFSIHGGDFYAQSGNAEPIFGPQLLVRNDLVVVTMNYRLGALGFLSLYNEKFSGNAGLKDVLLVLKIVHDNIAKFGGDPNRVTIRGSGAGGVMGGLLLLTKDSNRLFQTVMIHCGSFLSSKYIQLDPRENAISLARELGLDVTSDDRIMEKLKVVNAFDIIDAQEAMRQKDPRRGCYNFRPFKPTVEIDHEGAVITRSPMDLIRDGAVHNVPVYVGFNDQEGLEILPQLEKEPELIDKLNENFELLIPEDIKYPQGSAERKNLAAKMRKFYFNGGNITLSNIQDYINLISDSQYTYSIDLFVKLFKEKNKGPLYYYVFASDNELNWFKAFANITYPGAAHSDNIGYAFVTSATKSKYQCLNATTKHAQEAILQNIKSFADCGAPPASLTNAWHEAGQNRYHTVINNRGATPVFHGPIPERIGFWSSVYEEYAESQKPKKPEEKCDKESEKKPAPKGLIPAVLGLVGGIIG